MCENQRSMGEIRTGPRERLVFLDLARGLAIVFMVLQHAVLLFATGQGEGLVLGKIVLLLGGAPAAPVFLFIMGIFLGRPDRKIGRGVRRGLKLIALGYLLNLLRSTLPSLFTGPEIASATVPASPLASFWAVDILQMAGLSFVLLTLLRRYLPFRWVWAILAAAVAFVSPLLWHWGGPSGVYALWGNRDDVFFPLFPWVAYPLAGMVYNPYALAQEGQSTVTHRSAAVGALFFAVGAATFFLPREGQLDLGQYFQDGPGAQVATVGFVLVWLSFCRLLARRRAGSAGLRLLSFWSRNVTAVYFVQWILYGWAVLVIGRNRYGSPMAMGVATGVLLAAHAVVKASVARAGRRPDPPDGCAGGGSTGSREVPSAGNFCCSTGQKSV